jgi:S-disulfanyl-L-cysteine oxidoreductase SoxD
MSHKTIQLLAAGLSSLLAAQVALSTERYELGRPISAQELAGWDIDVRPDGVGLPPGRGSVKQGREVYANTCAVCHGDNGEGRPVPGAVGGFDRLVGGFGTLDKPKPVMTVGSFWPYATTLFDYVRRAMPFQAPQSLTADEVYAVSAYILFMNNIVPEDAVMDAQKLPQVRMPNRDGFTKDDPRPDVQSQQ